MRKLGAGAVVMTLLFALAAALPAAAGPAAAPRLSKPVQTALLAAQKLAAEKNFPVALESAKTALAASTTPDEQYKSNEMLAFIHVQMRNNSGAADAFEALLASGLLPPAEVQTRMKNVCQLRYATQDWPRAIAACGKFAEQFNDRETKYLVAQIYYQTKNWPMLVQTGRAALVGDANPPKAILQMLGRAYYSELKDMEGTQWAYEQIVDFYPDPRYWMDLLSMVEQKHRTDPRYVLDVARLRVATGVAEIPGELIDLADAAIKIGLPGEAKAVLERASAAGQTGTGADRTAFQAMLATARTEATTDLRTLASAEAESKKSPKGEADLRTGEALVSHGRVDQGIVAIQRGIAKGGLKDATEAQLRLGLALLAANRQAEALTALDAATAGTGKYTAIARLWAMQMRNVAAGNMSTSAEDDSEEESEDAAADADAGA